ncbi:hypothetical protein Tco_0625501 [Tanacetum coccineum]|uniref:Uncharacterized protein n=1 Tax=Tanacetum coccineum TaxID=301880 RepID=A0ABQ4WH50_9ASTR
MAYSLVRLRKSSEGCAGFIEALLVSLSWRQTKDYLNPLETVIMKPAEVKVITYSSEDAEGMMKNYKSSRSSKVLEAVVKVLVIGIRDMVLETISVYCLDPEDLEALKRLSRGSVRGSLEGSLRDSVGSSLGWFEQAMVQMSSLGENQTWFFGQVTSRKAKVMKWMFKGVKAFSHVNYDEYICVALSEGLLIARKEDLTCVETLNGWVVGFDEVLVAESNMTKISKLMRWVSLEKNSTMLELGEALTCLLKNQGRWLN